MKSLWKNYILEVQIARNIEIFKELFQSLCWLPSFLGLILAPLLLLYQPPRNVLAMTEQRPNVFQVQVRFGWLWYERGLAIFRISFTYQSHRFRTPKIVRVGGGSPGKGE